jgi:hypothetical protein
LDKSSGTDETRIAQLEWAYLPLLTHNQRQPRLLHQELAQNPSFFIEVLKFVYWPDKEDNENALVPSEENAARVKRAYKLLKSWKKVPGLTQNGTVDSEQLKVWISSAREACHTSGRGAIGDQTIGQVLAYSPADPDGIWPDVSVRKLIEELTSRDLEAGIEIGVHNKRGVYTKSLSEGGRQEREIAEKYQKYATAVADEFPRTASLLRRIADGYTSDAHREDIYAELEDNY